MCGFVFYYKKTNDISLDKFSKALALQHHRGPDHQGIAYKIENAPITMLDECASFDDKASMAFGHRRLSIVDLSPHSNQPVMSRDSQNVMLFNGEFYNYADYIDSTKTAHSDTLTLFSLLEKEGMNALHHVNGMWGLCYYLAAENRLYLARDRYGKKPVYYYQDEQQYIAASEMKSIFALLEAGERKVNPQGLAYYLLGKQTPFMNDAQTFYRDIRCVKPGEIISFDIGSFETKPHAKIGFEDCDLSFASDDGQFIQALHDEMHSAIKIRLKSEVPVTILASGGVDSTWIASVASENLSISNNLSLYTCHIVEGDDEVSEDLAYARALAKDLDLPLHEVEVEKSNIDEFMQISRLLTGQVELPLNLFLATIPTYLMTKSMAAQGIKVVLDGVGGDEIMGGYPSYSPLVLANAYNKNFAKAFHYFQNWKSFDKPDLRAQFQMLKSALKAATVGNNLKSVSDQLYDIFSPYIQSAVLDASMQDFMTTYFMRHKLVSQTDVQLFEIGKYQLPYYLGIADQMSMINSVENRSPYLDKNLHKYIFMPEHLKFQNGYNKYALRAAMPNNISDKFRWRSGKVGIGNAFSQNLVSERKPYECVMDSKFLRSFIDIEKLSQNKGDADYHHVIRPLFSLALLDDIYGLGF